MTPWMVVRELTSARTVKRLRTVSKGRDCRAYGNKEPGAGGASARNGVLPRPPSLRAAGCVDHSPVTLTPSWSARRAGRRCIGKGTRAAPHTMRASEDAAGTASGAPRAHPPSCSRARMPRAASQEPVALQRKRWQKGRMTCCIREVGHAGIEPATSCLSSISP
jgi:hypothetical protein